MCYYGSSMYVHHVQLLLHHRDAAGRLGVL
jgi:hypothetical protein